MVKNHICFFLQIMCRWEQHTPDGVNQRVKVMERSSSTPASPQDLTTPTVEQHLTFSVSPNPHYGTNMTMPNMAEPWYMARSMNSPIETDNTSLEVK